MIPKMTMDFSRALAEGAASGQLVGHFWSQGPNLPDT